MTQTSSRPPAARGPAPGAAPPGPAAASRVNRMTLASVTRAPKQEPDRIFLYGMEKLGKTTFAASAPNVVFISSENGLAEIQPAPARFPEVRSFQDVLDAVETLTTQPHEFTTLAIDSMDWVAHLLNEEVRQRNKLSQKDFDAYGRGYKLAFEDWRKLLLALERMQDAKPIEVILIAHAEAKNVDPPDANPYVRFQPKMGGGGVAASLVKEWCKSILFCRHEYVVKDGEGFARSKGVATGRRVIHTEWTAAWDAGSRFALPPELPLEYAAYAEARDAGRTAFADRVRAEITEMVERLQPSEEARAAIGARLLAAAGDVGKMQALATRLRAELAKQEATPAGEAANTGGA